MKVTFSALGRYMAKRFAITILGVFFLFLLLIFFFDFIEIMRIGANREGVTSGTLVLISALRVPIISEVTLPFAVLLGTMGAFLGLSRTSELTIVRGAGLSVWQFLQPAVTVAFVFGVLAVAVYNPLASAAKAESERMQTELFDAKKNFAVSRGTGSWLRQEGLDGATILHAKTSANRGLTLGGVTLLQFDLNNKFYEEVRANKAELRHGYWRLESAIAQGAGEAPRHYEEYFVSTYLTREQIMDSLGSVETLSFWQLPAFIDFAKKAGIPELRYELAYQLFLARPILLAAMVLIAATSSLKPFRFGKIQTMVLAGLSGGFAFFIFSEFSRKVGASGLVPVSVAAWGPALVALLLSATVLLYQEDG
jgi:lipopolysaccharide export system permease protein